MKTDSNPRRAFIKWLGATPILATIAKPEAEIVPMGTDDL